MSKREIEKVAKREQLTVNRIESGHQGAMLFDSAGRWYEVEAVTPDGFEATHSGDKAEVIRGLEEQGQEYRDSLEEPLSPAAQALVDLATRNTEVLAQAAARRRRRA